MRLHLPRLSKRRWWGTFFIAGFIGLVWVGWWLAPPVPEVRLKFTNTGTYGWWTIAGDGQSLIHQKEDRPEKPGGKWQAHFVEISDLPSGRSRTKITDPEGLGQFEASPDGKHFVCQARNGSWRIYQLSSGKLVGTIPPIQEAHCEWSADGRFLALETRDRGVTIVRVDTASIIHEFDYSTPIRITPTSGELIAVSKTGKVDVWTLEPFRRVDSLALPYPSSGDRNEHTDAPPQSGTVHIRKLGCSYDGQHVLALFNRFEPEGDGLAAVSCIGCWNRSNGRRAELIEGNYDIQHVCSLQISANGRFVSNGGSYWLGSYRLPDWLKWRDSGRDRPTFWDLHADQTKQPNHSHPMNSFTVEMEPQGKRIVTIESANLHIVRDDSLAPIGEIHAERNHGNEEFDSTGSYLAIPVKPSPLKWLPIWTPTFVMKLLAPPESAIWIIRLLDGKVTKQLSNRNSLQFTSDGKAWTTVFRRLDSGEHDYEVTLERWSPEAPWPPWWLWLITAGGVVWIARRWRKVPQTSLPIRSLECV